MPVSLNLIKQGSMLLLLFSFLSLSAQKDIVPSSSVVISGQVASEITISLEDLAAMPAVRIKDVTITNHLGEKRGKARKMKGVLLKNVFSQITLTSKMPKDLSELYLVCVASDGYRVVFSWNELFNSDTGHHTFIVVEKDGKKLADMPDRILLLTASDHMTGRRFVKGLSRIEVRRAE